MKSDENPAEGLATIVRDEQQTSVEQSLCGTRRRLLSRDDQNVAAWAHVVEMDGSQPHVHRRATELYYVLEGEESIVLDGNERKVRAGTIAHIPPGVVHSTAGHMRVLVIGIPDISDDDVFEVRADG